MHQQKFNYLLNLILGYDFRAVLIHLLDNFNPACAIIALLKHLVRVVAREAVLLKQ